MVAWKILLQSISNPMFYDDLVYRFKIIIGNILFIKIINHYKRVGNSIDVMGQSACLVINQTTVYSNGFLFYLKMLDQASDSMRTLNIKLSVVGQCLIVLWLGFFFFNSDNLWVESPFSLFHIQSQYVICIGCFPVMKHCINYGATMGASAYFVLSTTAESRVKILPVQLILSPTPMASAVVCS